MKGVKEPGDVGLTSPTESVGQIAAPVLSLLTDAFGSPLAKHEQHLWTSMSMGRQEEAIKRLELLLQAERAGSGLTAADLAAKAGLSLNRWYEMQRQWREHRSLASIGTDAAKPRQRVHANHNDLQRLVVEVIKASPDANTKFLATALGEAFLAERSTPELRRPAYNTLRKFVEQEQRRRSREAKPGNELQLDCCACYLPYSEGIFLAYFILDKATGAILGAGLSGSAKSREGYAVAADDGLSRLQRDPLVRLPWADRLERSEIVVGLDKENWERFRSHVLEAGLGAQLQLSTANKRFGRYAKKLLGDRFGRIKLLPAQTTKADPIAQPTQHDIARFAVEVDVYNASLFGASHKGHSEIPNQIIEILIFLTKAQS